MQLALRLTLLECASEPTLKERSPALSKTAILHGAQTNKAAIIVCGKRMPQGILTAEGKSRVAQVVTTLPQLDLASKYFIVFSGHQGEAEAMAEYFRHLTTGQALPPHQIFLETNACNTLENAAFSCQLLQQQGICPGWILLVSSDYHLRWMEETNKFLPHRSDLAPYRQYFPGALLLSSPASYPYVPLGGTELALAVDFHLLTHRFRPLNTMLHGLSEFSATELHPEIITDSLQTYNQLLALTNDSTLMPESILGIWNQNQALLATHLQEIASMGQIPQPQVREWSSLAVLIGQAITQMRWASDPESLNETQTSGL